MPSSDNDAVMGLPIGFSLLQPFDTPVIPSPAITGADRNNHFI